MTDQRPDVHWTAKLPTLVAGIALAIAGLLVGRSRFHYAIFTGAILLALGLGFVAYSMTIKEWCVVNQQSAFSSGFSQSFRGCLRMKGWLEW